MNAPVEFRLYSWPPGKISTGAAGGHVLRDRACIQSWHLATWANSTPLILCPLIQFSNLSISCFMHLSVHLGYPSHLEEWENFENKNQEKRFS